jgi:ribonuclease D
VGCPTNPRRVRREYENPDQRHTLKQQLRKGSAQKSNWSREKLTAAQVCYAANDAYAAIRVYTALSLGHEQAVD